MTRFLIDPIEFAPKPGSGVCPVSIGRTDLKAKLLGGLLDGHPKEEPEVYQLGGSGMLLTKSG